MWVVFAPVILTGMSFVDRAFAGALDYGDLLPRGARRALGCTLLALVAVAPKTYISLATRYGEERARAVVELIQKSLPDGASTERVP